MSDEFWRLKISRELNKTLGVELLKSVKQLREDLIEDALETPRGTSLMTKKIKSGKLLPLLIECEATMRTRDELMLECMTANKLAELLCGTTRALLDAPDESMQIMLRRLPPAFAAVLTQWVSVARGENVDVDTIFDEPKKTMSKGKLRKRKRVEMSDDEGEGPSGGTRDGNARTEVNKVGGDGTNDFSDVARDGPGGEEEVPCTNEFPSNTANSPALVSSIVAEKTPPLGASQANNIPTPHYADHTMSPTEQNNTQWTALATQAASIDRANPTVRRYTSEPFILDSDAD